MMFGWMGDLPIPLSKKCQSLLEQQLLIRGHGVHSGHFVMVDLKPGDER